MSACRLSSPQKLDRVLLSYGFNSYRLRVNKLELELDVRLHALDLLRDRAAFITALVPGRARESVPSRADELVRAVLGVYTEHRTRKEHRHQLKKTGLLAILSCHGGYLFESVANIAEVENGEHKCWSETAD